jgi:hypothetical protein
MRGRARPLLGRAAAVERLAAVVRGARDGTSGALVLLGDPGIGKSALLRAAAAGAGAASCRVVEVVGHEAERAIPHAALDRRNVACPARGRPGGRQPRVPRRIHRRR